MSENFNPESAARQDGWEEGFDRGWEVGWLAAYKRLLKEVKRVTRPRKAKASRLLELADELQQHIERLIEHYSAKAHP